ncbi:MAG TPA: glycosyltransferase family 2 protein [Candidatus Paceibacterota bacterium]|nr:glycosyltransferase family 2 protein [Candidatus Paceibacterota bacterium]
MKTSVLIIAHNEERYIAECIRSVLRQTKKPDEVVLMVHNSTDQTEAIAKTFPITVVPFSGSVGITYARIEGLKHLSGDVILCIDGDSYAKENWVAEMVATLEKPGNVLVGSWVKYKGTIFGFLSNWFNKFWCVRQKKVERWIWGSSFAFWGRDKEYVREVFEKSFALSKELGLSRNVDDYWLALFMKKRGRLEITNKTHVVSYTKEVSTWEVIRRNRENMQNAARMEQFLKNYSQRD